MEIKPLRPKKCKVCKEVYQPFQPLSMICSPSCASKYATQLREKKEKKEGVDRRRVIKKMKDKIKTNQDYVQELQKVFNTFIRLRDRDSLCICCNRPLTGKYDCGHYFPAGSYPMIRFDEDNAHGQTVHCNRDKHGNLAEYTIYLPKRIGEERFEALKQRRLTPRKYTIPELIEMKVIYKDKIRVLSK